MKKRNVILVTIDSLRADHISCLGYVNNETSAMDSLTRSGALFTQAFSNGGGSATSFPSIMTSTYSLMNPNSGGQNEKIWVSLSNKWITIAEALRSKGFSTAAFKNIKMDLSSVFGYDRGFDIFDDPELRGKTMVDRLHRKIDYLRGNKYQRANIINQKAFSWLKKHPQLFFLWLHYMDVHLPYNPKRLSITDRLNVIRLDRKTSYNAEQLSSADLKILRTLYDAEIEYIDEKIGTLLCELNKMGLSTENTFFIVLSDHGDQHFEHGEWGHGRLYDEVLHVPLIICGPDIDKRSIVEEQVSLLDVPPTIIDLLGIKKVESFHGNSLLSLIEGEHRRQESTYVISEEIDSFSCRTTSWKYIRHYRSNTHELYNLKSDPSEKTNLANKYPEKTEECNAVLDRHLLIEKQDSRGIIEEQRTFSTKEHEFLERVNKKEKTFFSTILGIPRNNT